MCLCIHPLNGASVKWEIYQAFPSWVEGEHWRVFAKVTNRSDEVVPLAGYITGSLVQQMRLVPEWKEGMTPHFHGPHSHIHHLAAEDEAWKSTLDWREWPLNELDAAYSLALMPGQAEVLGDMAMRLLWMDYGMPNPHLDGFQLALRLGPDRYAVSESQSLVFANVGRIEEQPILVEVEKENGRTTPIRQIEVAGETWLFQRSFRIARVPEGATPRFRTEDEKATLVIEFDGVDEEVVRVNIAQAFPLSGSERTVPHLHLWRSLTDRSMFELAGSEGGFFKETGLTLEQARTLKWDGSDPELNVGSDGRIQGFRDQHAIDLSPGTAERNADLKIEERGEGQKEEHEAWIWVVGGLLFFGVLVVLVGNVKRRASE